MAEKNQITKTDVGQQVIQRIDQLCQVGFTMPKDYNYVNAIKAAMLMLPEIKGKDGRNALEACKDNNSIQTALFKMSVKGLDATKKQCYLILRGNQLCMEESYFGVCLQARRVSKNYEPIANVIYKGDTFRFEVNPETGRKRIVEHTQTLESIDSGEIVGAYAIVTNDKGESDIEIMSMGQIRKSWAKSSSTQQLVHKEFPDQMAKRTVIKRAAKLLINSSLGDNIIPDDELENPIDVSRQLGTEQVGEVVEYEEVTETVDASTLGNKEELNGANAGDSVTAKEEKKEQIKERPF